MRPTGARGRMFTFMEVDGLSNGFLSIARECLEDARNLDASSPQFQPLDGTTDENPLRLETTGKYILTAHALELGLKAFLAKRGFSEKQLANNYRHNLDRLYSEAVEHGLSLSSIPEVKHTIAWINEYHDNGAVLRYSAKTKTLPACNTLFPIIDAILAAASAPIEN
jgi:hypothetical protein